MLKFFIDNAKNLYLISKQNTKSNLKWKQCERINLKKILSDQKNLSMTIQINPWY